MFEFVESVNPVEPFFQSLAKDTGFPIDQVRYIALLFFSYPLGWIYRNVLHPAHTSLLTRYLYAIILGGMFGFLCFGVQMYFLFGVVAVSYAMLKWMSPATVQRYTMVWAMGSMSVAHYYRLVTDYGGWTLDFTGPLMIIVQKITLVAFALHDGKSRKDSSLNADQRDQKLEQCPSLLEYFGYTFNFHSLLAGPTCTIKEYTAFVNGSNLQQLKEPDDFTKAKEDVKEPSAFLAVVSKLVYAMIAITLFVVLSDTVTSEDCWDPTHNLAQRVLIMYINCFRMRCKYYFVWLLVESVNNLTGLGFNGYDKSGNAKWDLVTNVHVLDIEMATSLKALISGWNALTANWLRRVCYDRVTFSPTLLTFALSAWWHGFYPGYFFVFVYFAIQTTAARKMRRLVRPYFQTSMEKKWFYDAVTFFVTHIFLDYGLIFAIEFLRVDKGLRVWSYYYYMPIIVSAAAILIPDSTSSKSTDVPTSKAAPSVNGHIDESSIANHTNTTNGTAHHRALPKEGDMSYSVK